MRTTPLIQRRKSFRLERYSGPTARGNMRFGMVMALPALALIGLVIVYPLVYALLLSLRSSAFPGATWVGLSNYQQVLQDPGFYTALTNTLRFTGVAVVVEVLLGLILAGLLQTRWLPAKGVVRSLLLLPLMVAPTVAALEWQWLYNDQYGALAYLLSRVGIPATTWLTNPSIVLYSAVAVDVWVATPFAMLVFQGALLSLPSDQMEAAQVDGANWWQGFWYIVLPHLRGALLVVLLIRTMDAFRVFDIIFILTGGGPGTSSQTLSVYAYQVGFNGLHLEESSAISFLMVIMISAISAVYLLVLRRRY